MVYNKKEFCAGLAMAFGIEALTGEKGNWINYLIAGMRRIKKEPVAYRYNGVILPKLPKRDMEEYPYAYIITNDDGRYLLVLQPTYLESYLNTSSGKIQVWENYIPSWEDYKAKTGQGIATREYYTPVNGAWVFVESKSYTADVAPDSTLSNYVWTNYNIADEDGTVRLPASNPVPEYTEVEPMPYPYNLYNGVQLPVLPNLETETRQYVVVRATGSENAPYEAYYCTMRPYLNSSEKVSLTKLFNPALKVICYYNDGVLVWENGYKSVTTTTNVDGVFWTNTDILDTVGSVYLEASEPIPVYE